MYVSDALEKFQKLQDELNQRIEDLHAKRELLNAQKEGEMVRPSVWMMDSWSAADVISKKEESIARNKKEKIEIDLLISGVYETLTSMQLHRLSAILNKLQALRNKNPQQTCPMELTMERYEDWMKNDAQVNAKQSEILQALTKKVRLTQKCAQDEEYHVMVKGANVYQFDVKKEFERLEQRRYIKLEQNSTVERQLSDYVRRLLKLSGCNFEAVKLREFIDQCHKTPDYGTESVASPQNYQSFVCAMSQYIVSKYDAVVKSMESDPSERLDQIYSLVEDVLFPQVKEIVELQLDNQCQKDKMLEEKYKKFADVDQQTMGIKETFLDTRIHPHCKAITEIMKVNIVNSPTRKIRHILTAAHEIICYMNSLCGEDDMVPGADEFMDIWVYVILKARLPRFFTTVSLLRDYSNPRIRLSESGYYMASFEFAGEYIRTLTDDFAKRNIQMQSARSKSANEVFFAPEVSRCREFAKRFENTVHIIDENFCFDGFKLVVDYDFQLEYNGLYTSFLVEDPECCVFGSLFSCPMNSNINNKGIKAQMKRISRNVSVKTFKGINVAVRDSVITDMSSFPRYIEIPSGRYDDYRLALERHLCYERLGSSKFTSDSMTFYEKGLTHDAINVNDLLRRHSSPHLTDYCGGNVESTDDVIIEKVKDIQTRLRSFDCYSKILPINGIYNTATLQSVKIFQKMCNAKMHGKAKFQLDVDGICDSRTFDCLQKIQKQVFK